MHCNSLLALFTCDVRGLERRSPGFVNRVATSHRATHLEESGEHRRLRAHLSRSALRVLAGSGIHPLFSLDRLERSAQTTRSQEGTDKLTFS